MPGKKIKSTSGATILLALLFFLMCAVVGSVILAAGTASSGRVAGLKDDEQEYYTLTSAAKVIRDEIDGQVISCWSSLVPKSTKKSNVSLNQEPTGYLKKLLTDATKHVFTGNSQTQTYKKIMKITVNGESDNILNVNAEFTIDNNYDIDVIIYKGADASGKTCKLHIPAAISLNANESSGQEKSPSNPNEIVRYTTTLTWTDSVITNG